tara:strand:+ start:477 stop:1043 length:567 start_codon:yes stop_codon:yes gene_type:complete
MSIVKLAKAAAKIRKERLKKSAEEAKKVRKKGKDYDKKIKKNIVKDISKGKKPTPAGPMPGQPKKPMSKNKKLGALTEGTKKKRRDARIKRMERAGPLGLRKPKDEIPLKFAAGGVAKKVASSLINKYKPKLKNQKEDYGLYSKQDYSDVIKNYEKTQKRKQRNRKAIGSIGGVTAATVVASNAKDKK